MKKSTVQEVRETELEFKEPSSQTWRLDLENNRITKSIDQLEAVVQAAFMALETERYAYPIFSWQYGSELRTLIGTEPEYARSETVRMISDALLTDSRIKDVRDFIWENGTLFFTLDTIFGVHTLSREVYLK